MIDKKIIIKDILVFERRIVEAREKLAALPDGYADYREHQKREKKKRELLEEIKHVKRLIEYSKEGLTEWS